MRQHHILIADDDHFEQKVMQKVLNTHGNYKTTLAKNGHEVLFYVKKDESIDLVLLDLSMPDMSGFSALESLRDLLPDLPVIIVTGSEDIKDAIYAMRLGANDFITKPILPDRLLGAIDNLLAVEETSPETATVPTNNTKGDVGFATLIGYDAGLKETVSIARRAAPSMIPVLINGESGVGKELFARAIHQASDRATEPFIAVNCGAIPEKLVESTLFGHEKGSFTGAVNKKAGKFLEAQNGTLFLDEVGELPLDTQVKLLRALQQKEIEPVGASRSIQVDVRVVSATNRQLVQEIHEGRFREDLYFRLNGLPVHIPPLRERREDIPALIEHFLQHYSRQHHRSLPHLSAEASEFLLQHEWPGNVRELESAIFRAVVLDTDGIIGLNAFTHFLSLSDYKRFVTDGAADVKQAGYIRLRNQEGNMKTLRALEWEIMEQVLQAYDGNVVAAAQALGIGKSTMYRRIDEEKASGKI